MMVCDGIIETASDSSDTCKFPRRLHATQTTSPDGRTVTFDLNHKEFVSQISIKICTDDRALVEGQFTVKYKDPTDYTGQERIYSEELRGVLLNDDSNHLTVTLERPVYAIRLSVSQQHAVACSSIHVVGCDSQDMCRHSACKNGGTCVGNGQCACATGYMGPTCEETVQNMTFDDFDFITNASGILYTNAAAFNITGDVSFTYDDGGNSVSSHRRRRTLGYSRSFAHFLGQGGSLLLLPALMTGFHNSHHNTFGHLATHNTHSALHNFKKGFSHTVQAIFGAHHHHHNTHYFYTTHGTSHHTYGSSFHYINYQLHFHVHFSNRFGHHNHFYAKASFRPAPGVKYTLVTSFSPHFGVSIYKNGHKISSQTLPNLITNTQHFGIPQPLCFGLCGAKIGLGPVSLSVGNMAVAGASVPTLAKNFLLGTLGAAMFNLFGRQHHSTVAVHASTPLQTNATTALPGTVTTAVTKGRFTLAPTTLPPATATTGVVKFSPNFIQVCSVFKGSHGYTHRCMSKQLCETNKKTAKDCWNCCRGNLCNDKCTTTPTCTDQPRCILLRSVGYNVCNDPIASISVCPQSCHKCPAIG